MAVNPNIALAFRPTVELESPGNMMAQAAQIRGLEGQNRMRAMQLEAAQQEQQRQNALLQLRQGMPGDLSPQDRARRYYESGFAREADEALKLGATLDKDRAAADRSRVEAEAKQVKMLRDMLPAVTPENFRSWQAAAVQTLPQYAQLFEGEYSPERVQQLMQTADKFLAAAAERNKIQAVAPNSTMIRDGQVIGQAPPAPQRAFSVRGGVYDPERGFMAAPGAAAGGGGTGAGGGAGGAAPGVGKPILTGPFAGRRINARGELEDIPIAPGSAPAGLTDVPPVERQKRDAALPKARASFSAVENDLTSLEKLVKELRDHPGLSGMTGLIFGRTPNITADARRARALYDQILARGGFSVLADMRAASPTGGALGNVSDREGDFLRQAFAALNTTQDTRDVKNELDRLAIRMRESKTRLRNAFEETYAYRPDGGAPSSGGAAGGGPALSPQDEQALQWAQANPNDPRAAEIRRRLGR